MSDENTSGRFNLNNLSDRTRKIIFGSLVVFLLAIVAIAFFVISPMTENEQNQNNENPNATQAPVPTETPTDEVVEFPRDEMEEAQNVQQDIIEQSEEHAEENQDENPHDDEPVIENAEHYMSLAEQGTMAYCAINEGETTEQRKAKMKPFFHESNSTYQDPTEFYYHRTCSIEAVTEPFENEEGQMTLYVGVAWAAQTEKDGPAESGYSQYTVVLDDSGIVEFYD